MGKKKETRKLLARKIHFTFLPARWEIQAVCISVSTEYCPHFPFWLLSYICDNAKHLLHLSAIVTASSVKLLSWSLAHFITGWYMVFVCVCLLQCWRLTQSYISRPFLSFIWVLINCSCWVKSTPASVFQCAGVIGMCHHIQLNFHSARQILVPLSYIPVSWYKFSFWWGLIDWFFFFFDWPFGVVAKKSSLCPRPQRFLSYGFTEKLHSLHFTSQSLVHFELVLNQVWGSDQGLLLGLWSQWLS